MYIQNHVDSIQSLIKLIMKERSDGLAAVLDMIYGGSMGLPKE